jgi:hypothetical protein
MPIRKIPAVSYPHTLPYTYELTAMWNNLKVSISPFQQELEWASMLILVPDFRW